MATIREVKKKGKIISYCFTVSLGRDEQGKQIRKNLTWKPTEGMTPAKARKAAERAAAEWELEVNAVFTIQPPSPFIPRHTIKVVYFMES